MDKRQGNMWLGVGNQTSTWARKDTLSLTNEHNNKIVF